MSFVAGMRIGEACRQCGHLRINEIFNNHWRWRADNRLKLYLIEYWRNRPEMRIK